MACFFFFIFLLFSCAHPLPVLVELPDFSFQDQTGRAVARKDLLGKVWVADFIYTGCADICPLLTARMKGLVSAVQDPDVHFVSLTVDPETDTVERLAAYAGNYQADPNRWQFLTGPLKSIEKTVVEGFKLGMGKTKDFQLFHSDRFVLVDRKGRIRGYFESNEEGMKKLKDGIGGLVHEQ